MSFVSFASTTDDYLSAIWSKDESADPIKAIRAIDNFHEAFSVQSPEHQLLTTESLILKNSCQHKIVVNEGGCRSEEIACGVKSLLQDFTLMRSRLATWYQNNLLAHAGKAFVYRDIFASEQIDFYHRFIVYSIDPEDQLYYQIQYIKSLKNQQGEGLPLLFQHFLIISLVDHCQEGLFAEQGKICSIEILSKIARYYDSEISDDFIQLYVEKKQVYQMRMRDHNYLDQMQIIEKQKMLLMAIGFMRGFWANSRFIPFAKNPDGNCGNYCLDVCAVHDDHKYGALNGVKFLQDNSDAITVDMVDTLYPLIADQRSKDQVKPDNVVPDRVTSEQKKQCFIIRVFTLILDRILVLCRKITAFFLTKKFSTTNDDEQLQVISPILTAVKHKKHCSVSDEQYEKINLQVADFKEKKPDQTAFAAFLRSLYHDAKYSIDHYPQWFKYWHLKEALIASLLGIKIRMFVNKNQLEEVTQQEPCYHDASRQVCVWTDSNAGHDSELIQLHCFALMAKAIRHENRYFGINAKSPDYLNDLQKKFELYKKTGLTGVSPKL